MYAGLFFLAFLLSLLTTVAVRFLMIRFKIIDAPRLENRKIHKKKIPLGGGLAIFVSFFILVFVFYLGDNVFNFSVTLSQILALFFGGAVLMIGGFLDDKYKLSAGKQVLFPIIAALVIVLFKIGPQFITNPFGGTLALDGWQWGDYFILANILVFFWLLSMMYTTKLLDGLDGLVTGTVAIGAMVIFFLCLQDKWFQPDVAVLSIIFAGACVGFLVWNWHPAKIFLGEGGSLFTGFMLGSLAIISGSKMATALLVMAVPMIDIVRVVFVRIKKRRSIFSGDSEHLHYRLLKSGLTHRQAVWLFYSLAFLFGITTLFLQSKQKLIALIFLFVLMMLLGVWFSKKN